MMSVTVRQVKFTIESDVVSAFKARCAVANISMASALRKWMKTYNPAKEVKANPATRPHRRKAVLEIIDRLNEISSMEEDYRDNIPEQFAQRREYAESSCERIAEAIALLEEAF